MSDQKIKIFIASANEDKKFLVKLEDQLKEVPKYQINPWFSRFSFSKSLESSFRGQLDSNDFFIFLLMPNAQSIRISNQTSKMVANDNLILEFGAAYGRYGLDRTIIVQDPSVTLPTDLDGIKTIKRDLEDPTTSTFISIAEEIISHISKIDFEAATKRLHWLSLMKTKPGAQRSFTDILSRFEKNAKEEWDVTFENFGVLSGYHDNFLIFTVPSIENFTAFITALRRTYPSLKKVDSRLIFPNKYWHQTSPARDNFNCSTIAFLSCVPEHVESTYTKLLEAAQNEKKRGIKEIDILTIGITTGDSDVFFIVGSESYESYNLFIENHFHNKILTEGWLEENTTSRYILKDIKSVISAAPNLEK